MKVKFTNILLDNVLLLTPKHDSSVLCLTGINLVSNIYQEQSTEKVLYVSNRGVSFFSSPCEVILSEGESDLVRAGGV